MLEIVRIDTHQLEEVKQLYKAAGMSKGACGLRDIQQMQDYLGARGLPTKGESPATFQTATHCYDGVQSLCQE